MYLSDHALEAVKLLNENDKDVTVTSEELTAFGTTILLTNTPESTRKPLLKQVWKHLMKLESTKSYVDALEVWIEFVAKYFTIKEIRVALDGLHKKLFNERVS